MKYKIGSLRELKFNLLVIKEYKWEQKLLRTGMEKKVIVIDHKESLDFQQLFVNKLGKRDMLLERHK